MLRICEDENSRNFEILTREGEQIVLAPIDEGVEIEEFVTEVLRPFIENNTSAKGLINGFFMDLLMGRAENASLKGICFKREGIELTYEVYRISKSGNTIVSKSYKNTLLYGNTDYYALSIMIKEAGKTRETYLALFLGEDFNLVDNDSEITYCGIIAA